MGTTTDEGPFGFCIVMRCQDVRQLFDAYLDGDLSPSQATELGAHRLHCTDCRRALALMEVSGHIIASDRDGVELSAGFTDRLLACVESPRARWIQRAKRVLYIGGPMAAAAMIGLAFLGVFNRPGPGETRVLGDKEVKSRPVVMRAPASPGTESAPAPVDAAAEAARRRSEQWMRDVREKMDAVQQANMTVLQWIEFLKEFQNAAGTDGLAPGLNGIEPIDGSDSDEEAPVPASDIEDL